jgi:hypothetical protein
MWVYLFIYVFILDSATNSEGKDHVIINRTETVQRVSKKDIYQQIQKKMVQLILQRGNSSQYTKRETLWGGGRDQKLFTTNSHKTETKVVVGRTGEEQEVKKRQRKIYTESLQTYATSVTALGIQMTILSETQSVIISL